MCGIAGLSMVRPAGLDIEPAVAALAHRGPDGAGIFRHGHIQLAHTRLAIIDPSDAGAQPMCSADGRKALVFNGEIYNHASLRNLSGVCGAPLRGHSDTESLLQALVARGTDCLPLLNGIFAFAYYDRDREEMLLARDPMGVKPLYWCQTADAVGFASEIKALLSFIPLSRDIDTVALRKYLTFLWCPGERTLLQGVRKLAPGEAMLLHRGEIVRRWTYARLPTYAPRKDWSREECRIAVRTATQSAVERQMISDAPVGALLSGGVDSTAIVAAARRIAPDIRCFTMRMTGGGGRTEVDDDLDYARLAARALGVRLTEVEMTAGDLAGQIARMVVALDEPLADPAALNLNVIAQAARQDGIKVLLSGTGGDDIFSGYRRHTAASFDSLWDGVPLPLRRALRQHADGWRGAGDLRRRIAKLITYADQPSHRRLAGLFAWSSPSMINEILHERWRSDVADEVFEDFDRELSISAGSPDLERCLRLDQRFFLADHNLLYADKMGMAASVEVRVPLLDLELVALAATIPSGWKQRGRRSKIMFKDSQRGLIPDAVIDRSKRGFGVPLREWSRGGMQGLRDDLLSKSTLDRRGLFDANAVGSLLEKNDARQVDGSYLLFSIACIESWCRHFIDGAPHVHAAA